MAIAAQLDATNITLTPLSKKGKTEKYMKNARSLAVSFTVTKNVTAKNGMRTFYIRVMPPRVKCWMAAEPLPMLTSN